MARGYLGKISAVISANTGDYVRKLNESAKETANFAKSVQQTLGRASSEARKSLESIYTPLQQVERALRAASSQKLSFRGFDGAIRDVQSLQAAIAKLTDQKTIDLVVKTSGAGSLDELKRTINVLRNQDVTIGVEGLRQQRAAIGDTSPGRIVATDAVAEANRLDTVIAALEKIDAESLKKISIQVEDAQLTAATTQFRRLTELSTQVGAPLAKIQAEFSGLSGTIQAQFIPSLAQAQNSYEQFQQRIKDNSDIAASEFRGLVADVKVVENAISRLRETAAAGGKLFTGEELTFVRPQAVDELNKLAAAQQKLAAAPAGVRGSPVARELLADGQVLQEQIGRISARIERLNAQGLDIKFSQAGLDRAVQRLQTVRRLTEEVAATGTLRIGVDDATAFSRRAAAEREFYETSKRLREQADSDERAILARRAAAEREFYEISKRLREQAAADAREAALAKSQTRWMPGNPSGEFGPLPFTPLTGNRDPQTRTINQLGQTLGDLQNRVRGIGGTLASEVGPVVDGLTSRFRTLAGSGIAYAAEEARRLAREAAGVSAALNSRQNTADRFSESFGGAGRAGLGLGVDERSLRAVGTQIEFVQTRLSSLSQEARGPVITALEALRTRATELFRGGALNTTAGRQQLAALREELVRTLSAAGGGSQRSLTRALSRVGDVGRAGVDRFTLGIQQAAFAIDDFFSVTGGLDQRLRAIGNNLTQLGFIVGGTTGLFTALAFTAGTQIAVALIKFIRGGADSEKIAKAFNDRLEQQKNLLKDVASGLDDIAGGVAENAFSEASKRAEEFESRLSSLIEKLKELRQNTAVTLDPEVFIAAGRLETRRQSLQGADSVPLASARLARVRDAEQALQQARDRAASRPPITRDELSNAIGASFGGSAGGFDVSGASDLQIRNLLRERESDLARIVDSWFYTFLTPFEQSDARGRISLVSEALARLDASIADRINALVEGQFSQSVRQFDATSGRTSQLLGDARQAGGDGESLRRVEALAESDATRFRSVIRGFNKAVTDGREEEANKAVRLLAVLASSADAREREASALLEAASASEKFSTALDRFSQLNDTVFGELSNAVEQARREAVQASGTSAAGLTRRDDAQFAQSRSERLSRELRDAEDRRQAVESNILEARRRFQDESPDPEVRRLALEAARARTLAESTTASDAARADARQRELAATNQLQRRFNESTQGRDLQAQLDEADRRQKVILERDAQITRGRDLSMTDGQRARRELDDSLRAINASFDEQARLLRDNQPFADLTQLEADRRKALNTVTIEKARQSAPAIFGLADSVANAIIQGPSRAALQATDVSTVEGSRELTRLLRGDDAAKDQANMVELQREANRLLDIIANNPAPVAN